MKKSTIVVSSALALLLSVPALAHRGPGGGHGRGPGAHLERFDQNKDGTITRAEADAVKAEMFAKLDTDRSGSLSAEELEQGKQAFRAARQQARFAREDANGDGFLAADETRMPAQRFAQLDTDGDGRVSLAELQAAPKRGPRRDPAKRFARLDANDDGRVTRDEVPRMPDARFQKLDQNGDGALSVEELSAGRPGKGARGHGMRGKGGLARLDQDGDGQVTAAEATAATDALFARLDGNADGQITPDERPRGKKGGRRGHGKAGAKAGKGAPAQ